MKPKTSNRNQNRQSDRSSAAFHTGFTLIEMIVSVALVLLMMLMFTEIFQILSGSMTTQRGISENDQRERLLVTVLQADLDNRSFQYLLPFADYQAFTTPAGVLPSADDPRSYEFHRDDRLGYFYISENDPNDDTDDLLQFTVSRFANPDQRGTEDFYYGRATDLSDRTLDGGTLLRNHPNQPEADDGRIVADGASQSSAAEVCYFLRGSNLYRRIMLIREPLSLSGTQNTQPISSDSSDSPFFQRTGSPPNPLYGESYNVDDNFWRDFDFSAYRDSIDVYARFHDLNELQNYDYTRSTILFPLGDPKFRFGFNHTDGLSREFIPNAADSSLQLFMGRFTHEETSHRHFNYPHDDMHSSIGGGGNPMNPSGPSLLLNPEDRVVDLLRNGPRRSEDLVLSNVRSFDIKVFDDGAQDFVDIGGSSAVRFAPGAKQNTNHGNNVWKNVFDTWHPGMNTGTDDDPVYPMLSDPTVSEHLSQSPVYDLANQSPVPRASPLSAIRILIRYEDPTSGQVRQMTLIHPLRNKSDE
ncbi:type II secretion system protein [Gimesia maris]|uniref:PulJ/GspJ family protein n=1 Tax=Gimesia maris TaxID=122 RepID=UPI0030DCB367|tara:strand:+ start:58532 stop:60112 length:1581 start_codon:yes stop_codon:yes gene_type:complete